jgi:acetoin utilization deacetylase AcuC-like enzyme
MMIYCDARCTEYSLANHPERPARIARTVPLLQKRHANWNWRQPHVATRSELLLAHSETHVRSIEAALSDFDADSPAYKDIFEHAARASGAAIDAARSALAGANAFSLMRPPGHHATRERAMGFCYFNHVAVAAFNAIASGVNRVAIWDFDAHHGNGTEAIVTNNPQIQFASIHQFPGYPGTGTRSLGNITNFPVPPYAPRAEHMDANRCGLDHLLAFQPDLLLVSAGFDAYRGDPITQMSLEQDDFATLGKWLNEIEVPTAAILEGGYSDQLPQLVEAFLTSWAGD